MKYWLLGLVFGFFVISKGFAADCQLSGIYRVPGSDETYDFYNFSIVTLPMNQDPVRIGPSGSLGSDPLRFNLVEVDGEISLGVHQGNHLFASSVPMNSDSVRLIVGISGGNFEIFCNLK